MSNLCRCSAHQDGPRGQAKQQAARTGKGSHLGWLQSFGVGEQLAEGSSAMHWSGTAETGGSGHRHLTSLCMRLGMTWGLLTVLNSSLNLLRNHPQHAM
jgi:hypothetical protein